MLGTLPLRDILTDSCSGVRHVDERFPTAHQELSADGASTGPYDDVAVFVTRRWRATSFQLQP